MAMENLVIDQSGFCSKTGIYSSKWESPILPSPTSSLSFPSFLLSQISPQFLQKPALIDSETGNAITYQDLRSLSTAISHYLHSLGVKKGDVILVLSFNSIYFPVLVLGILSTGAIFTTANALSTREELQYLIEDSKPVLVFTTQELHSKFDGNLVSGPIILIEELFEKLANDPKIPSKPVEVMVGHDDIATLMYSSGTTGKSKGVMSTHGTQIAQSCMVRHAWEADGDAHNDMHMCVVPLSHMFGFSIFICGALAVRSTVLVARKFSVEGVAAGIEKYKVTHIPVVPPMVVQLMKSQERMEGNKNLLGDLKEVISAGAPLGKEHIEQFNKASPQVRVSQLIIKQRKNMKVSVDQSSGFCSSTGIYYSKFDSLILPSETLSLSFPSFLLSQISTQYLQKPAFIDSKTGEFITYEYLRSLTITVSHFLRSLGIKKGDVVLVVSLNSIYFPLLALGIMSVGAVFSTANPSSTRQEFHTQIQDSNPVLIFAMPELHLKLDGLISRPVIMIGNFINQIVLDYTKFSSKYLFEFTVNQEDTAALMYSSGTTGKSKGVVISHRNLISQASILKRAWEVDGYANNDIFMCVLPLFHMFGLGTFIGGVLAARSTAVIVQKYLLEEMLVGIEKYKVTKLHAVPTMVVQLVRLQEKDAKEDAQLKLQQGLMIKHELLGLAGTLKEVICSGAPLRKDHMERFKKVYPQVRLSQVYGSTEAAGLITVSNGIATEGMTEVLTVSVGILVPSIEAKILHVESQEPQPPLAPGELCIRGPPIMKGYFKNEEATSLALDKEGWLHTGDLCFIDKFGLVYIMERIKEFIKYNAYQVAPTELEEILFMHPEVKDVAVTSYPDEIAGEIFFFFFFFLESERTGEIPMACVVRKDTSEVKEQEIIAFIANKVAPYKKIRKVVFVKSIPRSASGKILRRQLSSFSIIPASHQQIKASSKL